MNYLKNYVQQIPYIGIDTVPNLDLTIGKASDKANKLVKVIKCWIREILLWNNMYTSKEHVKHVASLLDKAIHEEYNNLALKLDIDERLKSWWNGECAYAPKKAIHAHKSSDRRNLEY